MAERMSVQQFFNAELLERLNIFRIEMPPLSRRHAEFEDIATGIMSEISRELHKEYLKSLSPKAVELLLSYDWPGNIRELRNVLRIAVIAATGDRIEVENFPEFGHHRVDFRATREQFEKTYLLELLRTFHWDLEKTCAMSRMELSTLQAKIRHHEIQIPPSASIPNLLF